MVKRVKYGLIGIAFTLLAIVVTPLAAQQTSEVDLELVLLADASGSIDDGEIRFQRQGYADAFTDPAVLAAIAAGLIGKIAITYVEWGAAPSQDVVVDWREVSDHASAERFGKALMAAPRRAFGRNAIGSAIAKGQALIETNAYAGMRRVIDFSADSAYNWGGVPVHEARSRALAAGIVINGLAILCRSCNGRPMGRDLESAFANEIIGGPGSFVVTVDDQTRFAAAVRNKLLLEISGSLPENQALGLFVRP